MTDLPGWPGPAIGPAHSISLGTAILTGKPQLPGQPGPTRHLQLCGPDEWLVEKHGSRMRRSWRKLHIGVDADTGRIVASSLTASDVDDASQVGPLLDQVADPIASFTADGAYDQDGVYAQVATRHPDAAVIVPPRSSAVPHASAETAPT